MKKVLNLILICLSILFVSGCGMFGSTETLEISSINVKTLENGDKEVTIAYVDEYYEPLVFVVPKGDKGDDGNGIGEVFYRPVDGGTEVEITFTKQGSVPLKFTVDDGISVTGIESDTESKPGSTLITFVFSDGSKSETYELPKGEKGQDGRSIVDIDDYLNGDSSVDLTIIFSDGTDRTVTIPAPIKGEDGIGIKGVEIEPKDDLGDKYDIILTLDDDTTISAEFDRVNKWFTDSAEPVDEEDGIDGDLYFCTTNKIIYVKKDGGWIPTIDLDKITDLEYDVIFFLNDTEDEPASMPSGVLPVYRVKHGMYFESTGYEIPIPTRYGYEFAGWYTTPDPKAIHGAFTDISIVASKLDLYAKWVKNE